MAMQAVICQLDLHENIDLKRFRQQAQQNNIVPNATLYVARTCEYIILYLAHSR